MGPHEKLAISPQFAADAMRRYVDAQQGDRWDPRVAARLARLAESLRSSDGEPDRLGRLYDRRGEILDEHFPGATRGEQRRALDAARAAPPGSPEHHAAARHDVVDQLHETRGEIHRTAQRTLGTVQLFDSPDAWHAAWRYPAPMDTVRTPDLGPALQEHALALAAPMDTVRTPDLGPALQEHALALAAAKHRVAGWGEHLDRVERTFGTRDPEALRKVLADPDHGRTEFQAALRGPVDRDALYVARRFLADHDEYTGRREAIAAGFRDAHLDHLEGVIDAATGVARRIHKEAPVRGDKGYPVARVEDGRSRPFYHQGDTRQHDAHWELRTIAGEVLRERKHTMGLVALEPTGALVRQGAVHPDLAAYYQARGIPVHEIDASHPRHPEYRRPAPPPTPAAEPPPRSPPRAPTPSAPEPPPRTPASPASAPAGHPAPAPAPHSAPVVPHSPPAAPARAGLGFKGKLGLGLGALGLGLGALGYGAYRMSRAAPASAESAEDPRLRATKTAVWRACARYGLVASR